MRSLQYRYKKINKIQLNILQLIKINVHKIDIIQ